MNINKNIKKILEEDILKKFISLNLKIQFEEATFSTAVYLMTYKENILGCKEFLKYLKDNTDMDIMVNIREFLSIYMICFFHNDVLSIHKNETEELLYEKCNELVEMIQEYISHKSFNLQLYIKKLNTFGILFDVWKEKDLHSQTDIYMSMYVDYNEEIETFIKKATDINKLDYYETYIKRLVNMKNKIKVCIIRLIGREEFNKLKDTRFNPIGIFNTESKNVIKNYLNEAYWNIFKNNIYNTTDNRNNIIDNLSSSIKQYMKNIYLNNNDKLQKLYTNIDFIINNIKHTGDIEENLIDLLYILYNELVFFNPDHHILEKVELKLDNLDTIDNIIYVFKLLMNEYNQYMS